MLLSLAVHEFAHALAADRLGDDTPRRQGRLTLSPLAHYDVLGTLIVPLVATLVYGGALIGWAKPVQFVPARMTRKVSMRVGGGLVALAGPLSNLLLASVSLALLVGLDRFTPAALDGGVLELLKTFFVINVALFVFNLLPLPPLDGSHLLPRSFDDLKASVAPFSFIIIMVVLSFQPLRDVLFTWPVQVVSRALTLAFGVSS